jgi:iron complex outermembrane receptor protein
MQSAFAYFAPRGVRLAVVLALPGALAGQLALAQTSQTSTDRDEVLEHVIVNGSQVELPPDYAGGQIARGGRAGLFGNLDVMDTPFNSTNYTAEFMRNLQAHSVADVVQTDPAVRVARGFGNFQELYVVRGFPVYSDDMSYNGLYALLPRQYVAAEFLERVEVFRGANSFLNGAAPNGSGIGGSFNLVPKRAPDGGLNRVTMGWENESQAYYAGDFARRMGESDRFGIRANGVYRDGETSVDEQERKLKMGSLGVDYRGERARFSADLGWQDHRIDSPRPSVTPSGIGGIPRPPDSSSNFAQAWTFSAEKDLFGVARGEFDITENSSVWAATGVRDSTEHNVLANPTSDGAGVTTANRFDNYREDRIDTSEIGFRTEFDTGAVSHKVSTQAALFELDSKNAYAFSNFAGFPGNLYQPIPVISPVPDALVGGVLFSPRTTTESKTSSFALADTLGFADEKVLLTLGARYQVIEQYSFNYNTGVKESGYDRNTITPVAGVVYKPSEQISVYGNYIEGLIPGEVAPTQVSGAPVSNAGEVFDPYKSKQYEVGAKYDGGTLGGTFAVFRLAKPTLSLEGSVVQDSGETRVQGIELSWYGQPIDSVRVLGGMTFLEATNEETLDGINDGNDVIGVPDTQVNLSVEWDVPGANGLSVDGRAVYTSSQAANDANTLSIPSWTRLDVGGRYQLDLSNERIVTVRLRVDNVTDKDYWASVGGSFNANYMVLGGPRTYTVSASLDF